jgi:hypothetical protein
VKPSVGRIVHYVSFGTPGGEYKSECRAAIVTEVHDDPRTSVGLCVLNPAGQFFNRAIPHDELPPPDKIVADERTEHQAGSWHWPEREPSGAAPQVHVNADLSPQQVKQVTEMIQAAILQQAKRGRRTGLA